MTELDVLIVSVWKRGGPVAALILILEQGVKVMLDLLGVGWVRQDDLREDANDAVGCSDVDLVMPGPRSFACEDGLDDALCCVVDQFLSFRVIGGKRI